MAKTYVGTWLINKDITPPEDVLYLSFPFSTVTPIVVSSLSIPSFVEIQMSGDVNEGRYMIFIPAAPYSSDESYITVWEDGEWYREEARTIVVSEEPDAYGKAFLDTYASKVDDGSESEKVIAAGTYVLHNDGRDHNDTDDDYCYIFEFYGVNAHITWDDRECSALGIHPNGVLFVESDDQYDLYEGDNTIVLSAPVLVSAEQYEMFCRYTEDATDTEGDTETIKVIKAGTYRFNDVLTAPNICPTVEIPFTTCGVLNGELYEASCSYISLSRSGDNERISYGIESFNPSVSGLELPTQIFVYTAGWYDTYGEGIQTITITKDTEVSAEFGTWFTENTKMLIKAGTYRWNDVIDFSSIPDGGSFSANIDFVINGVLDNTDIVLNGYRLFADRVIHEYDEGMLGIEISSSSPDMSALFPNDSPNTIYNNLWETNWEAPYYNQVQILTVLEDTYAPIDFTYWANENWQPYEEAEETPTAESVKAKIQNLIAKANRTTGKNDADLTSGVNSLVEGYGQGGSDCDGCVIEVEELPTENIDESAVYECEGKYYKYFVGTFRDVIIVYASFGITTSFEEAALSEGCTYSFNTIPTKTTDNVQASDMSTTYHWYFISDENDVFLYCDPDSTGTNDWYSWATLSGSTFNGVINDISEATADGYYALGGSYWIEYLAPSGSVTISENGTHDVSGKATAIVDVPVPDGYVKPSGTRTVTSNGTYDVTSYASAIVSVPTTYDVQTVDDLPTDAPNGSLAIVLGGE